MMVLKFASHLQRVAPVDSFSSHCERSLLSDRETGFKGLTHLSNIHIKWSAGHLVRSFLKFG